MTNLERQKILAMEAAELIKEYRDTIAVFGAEQYKIVEVNETYDVITTVDEDGEKMERNVGEISEEISRQLYGFGPCSGVFYENLDLCKSEFNDKYNELSKNDFMDYVGKVHYAEFRCVEICNRLEEIEEEFNNIE